MPNPLPAPNQTTCQQLADELQSLENEEVLLAVAVRVTAAAVIQAQQEAMNAQNALMVNTMRQCEVYRKRFELGCQ